MTVRWDLIGTEGRQAFVSFTLIMIKCVVGINHNGEIIKCMCKSNTTSACLLCGEIEYWDRVLLFEHNKNKREEWVKGLEIN